MWLDHDSNDGDDNNDGRALQTQDTTRNLIYFTPSYAAFGEHHKETDVCLQLVRPYAIRLAYVIYTHTKEGEQTANVQSWTPFAFARSRTPPLKKIDSHHCPRHRQKKTPFFVQQPALSGAQPRRRAQRHGSGASGGWCHRQGSGGCWSNRQQRWQSQRRHLVVLAACDNVNSKAAPDLPRGTSSAGICLSRRILWVKVWAIAYRLAVILYAAVMFGSVVRSGTYRDLLPQRWSFAVLSSCPSRGAVPGRFAVPFRVIAWHRRSHTGVFFLLRSEWSASHVWWPRVMDGHGAC